ncbi:MAG: hypothetical protein OXF46_05495 [Rhodobacteraceae bacterium]|nr:hypothetical protein [Paracoccaceae bacterium]
MSISDKVLAINFILKRVTTRTRNQSMSQYTPDLITVFLSVEVSRSSWVVRFWCPCKGFLAFS